MEPHQRSQCPGNAKSPTQMHDECRGYQIPQGTNPPPPSIGHHSSVEGVVPEETLNQTLAQNILFETLLALGISAFKLTVAPGESPYVRGLARLLGASHRLHNSLGKDHPSPAWIQYERLITDFSSSGMETTLSTGWAEGTALSCSQAVAAASAAITALAVRMDASNFRSPSRIDQLTVREQEVLVLLAQGLTDREIAERLFISRHTATTHVKHLRWKLGGGSRSAAIARVFMASPWDSGTWDIQSRDADPTPQPK